jgi:two-component system chemotaxis response regulator CheY
MRILLIDDSSTMRKIQRRVLSEMNPEFDVVEAGNGKEALEKLKEFNFQFGLVLCDINMPEMNGMETLKAIRSMPETLKLPIIMCTSVAEKGQVMEAIKAGATNYLVKPFQPEDLKNKINTVLSK